jgi:isocitrate dehydrogenase kinase/phosphatase
MGDRMPKTPVNRLAIKAVDAVLRWFDLYVNEFDELTRCARKRFECLDWKGRHADALERLDLYDDILERLAPDLHSLLDGRVWGKPLWTEIREHFAVLIGNRFDADRARTFYNSVTRKMFSTIGIDREIEFFSLKNSGHKITRECGICKKYLQGCDILAVIKEILSDHALDPGYENLDRDANLVAREVSLRLWPIIGYDKPCIFEVINPVFFRNKAAYIVGRIMADSRIIPLVLPMYNSRRGIYVDTVLLAESEVSIVFGFAYSYFHVDLTRYDALVAFLQSILPAKPVAELYTCIGFNRHGKTVFYRDLHRFIHESREKFVIAPGKEGAVMIVFTLPGYNFVFKVIKDRPCFLRSKDTTSKTITRNQVMERYNFVCHRDRVGRLVDTQEFENLRFRKMRFSKALMKEFTQAAGDLVTFEKNHVVIRHLYVQRKVTPLPINLLHEKNPESIRRVVIDFGYFLKDLAVSGIFPSDLFNTWNYGVTSRGRVVLFDYDDVMPLEKINFRVKPRPRDEIQEMELEENWIVAGSEDYFVEEISRYSGIPEPLRGIFLSGHEDLFSVDFWKNTQRRLKRGEIIDITPYDRSRRFRAGTPSK